jgi:ferric-dicitrate binding protein FerR (iron transport regulator)
MTLADGSRIWLNAGSSVTYPVAFTGKERKVSVNGEAYFEVAPDHTKPFFVSKGEMSLQVLGTHFNVNAYDDEQDIKITLLEGSVKVSQRGQTGLLKPGEQARVAADIKVANTVDLESVMAWKNGKFSFADEDLKSIMRQLMRWYDVDIIYQNDVPERFFTAEISRNKNLLALLKVLEASDIHFKIEGRKLTVIK